MLGRISQMLGAILGDSKIRRWIGGLTILAGISGAIIAIYATFREPLDIGLERRTIRLKGAKGRLPKDGLRILHISDTHFQGLEWRERAKIEKIKALTQGLSYDLLVHTGDFWHNEVGLHNVLVLLDNLPKPRLGSYGVLGNHDYACYSHSDVLTRNWAAYQEQKEGELNGYPDQQNGHYAGANGIYTTQTLAKPKVTPIEQLNEFFRFGRYVLTAPFELKRTYFNDIPRLTKGLENRGLKILTNCSVHLSHQPDQPDGVDLYLCGVDDVSEGAPNLKAAMQGVPKDAPTILLSHHPDILDESGFEQADLVLAGHTHGGQIVMPLLGPVHTHSKHLSRKEAAGYLWRGKTQVYISRGVGEGIPLRFCAKPQITLITVEGDG